MLKADKTAEIHKFTHNTALACQYFSIHKKVLTEIDIRIAYFRNADQT